MKILDFLKGLFHTFRPTIKKRLQDEMDKRQDEDINLIRKAVDKYDHGLSGEQLDDFLIRMHDVLEVIIMRNIDKL